MAKLRALVILFLIALVLAPCGVMSQSTPAPNSTVGGEESIVPFLNQNIVWYRDLTQQQQLATEPSDVLFFNDNRQLAEQVVRLAFEFARARAQALAAQPSASANSANVSPYQTLTTLAAKADQQYKDTQKEVDDLRQQLTTATGAKRRKLQATLDETQSEVELFQARRDTLRNMVQFATGATAGGVGSGTLIGQIEELARAVPSVNANTRETDNDKNISASNNANSIAAAARERRQEPNGILDLIANLFTLHRKIKSLEDNVKLTDALAQTSKDLRAPLSAKIRELTQRGDQLAAQADTSDPAALAQERKDLDSLTSQYKQLSSSLLPLGKQNILLDLYKRSTTSWRNAVQSQYETELKGLLLRLGGLGLILGVVLGVSELWRRATFRYVTDPRRRYQFLLLRRIVLWIVVAIIVALAFASELGTITTFAGLMTAGIAVALQNVILSVAGYFFLIGKYGVRVGDRVQVAGVTGDVVDIGLVRLHLMEVTGEGSPRPTGRVVVFSNSVVFQANAGLFKQIPGTSFVWHEITLTIGPEGHYHEAEQRLMEAVNKVYAEYHEKMELQRRSMERALNSARIKEFIPESRLRLTGAGLEIVIRYPVELSSAAEIDDRITRELIEAIDREPRLHLLGSTVKVEEAPAPAAEPA
ncbi:MAG TPA: mechanosensitive ion channel domain-containing protein [Candidatus Angelobacter sp.]|nr:mechanosensitive ion channel domain-containing protein [Candidatus Angelobacter sp.]